MNSFYVAHCKYIFHTKAPHYSFNNGVHIYHQTLCTKQCSLLLNSQALLLLDQARDADEISGH